MSGKLTNPLTTEGRIGTAETHAMQASKVKILGKRGLIKNKSSGIIVFAINRMGNLS